MNRRPRRLLEPLLNERELADLLVVSVRTVQDWRQSGQGPQFLKLTAKKQGGVRYDPADVRAYVVERRASSTVDGLRQRREPADERR